MKIETFNCSNCGCDISYSNPTAIVVCNNPECNETYNPPDCGWDGKHGTAGGLKENDFVYSPKHNKFGFVEAFLDGKIWAPIIWPQSTKDECMFELDEEFLKIDSSQDLEKNRKQYYVFRFEEKCKAMKSSLSEEDYKVWYRQVKEESNG